MIQGTGHGKGVDYWALGILSHELLAGYPPFHDPNVNVIYQKIRRGSPDCPPFFASAARDCVRHLLAADPARRLGCRRGGAGDVKRHAWFAGFDFRALAEGALDAPISVELPAGPGDTSNFDRYEETARWRTRWRALTIGGGGRSGGGDGGGGEGGGEGDGEREGRRRKKTSAAARTAAAAPSPLAASPDKVKHAGGGGGRGRLSSDDSPVPSTSHVFKDF